MNLRGRAFAEVLAPWFIVSAGMADAQPSTDQNATNASNNPLTPKIRVYLQNFFEPSVVGQASRTSDNLVARLYVPVDLAGVQSELRILAEIETAPGQATSARGAVRGAAPAEAPSEAGTDFRLGELKVFDLILQQSGNIEYGVGPFLVLPTASRPSLRMGTGTWQAGPAGVAVARWNWGLTGATITYSHALAGSDRSLQALRVEPLLLYNLANGAYLRSTGMWNFGFGTEPSYIPIGFGVGKVWKLPSGATLNLHFEPQASAYASKVGAPRWQILTGMIMQF